MANVLIKSGTNQFHGAAYERIYNSSLDAADKNDILNGVPKAKSRENIFGFRLGGPAIHDRLFFFVSNQWDRIRNTANLNILTVPTSDGYNVLRQFADNPRVATLVKAYGGLVGVNSLYAKSIDLGPDPACVGGGGGGEPTRTGKVHFAADSVCPDRGIVNFAGVQRSLGGGSNSRELEATADYVLSDKDKLRGRFIQSPFETPYDTGNFGGQLPGFDTDQDGTVYNAGLTETHIFSPTLLNELRLAWSRIGFNFALRPETIANPLALAPAIGIANITGYGIPAGSVPQGRFQNTYQLQDALSWTRASHSFKFGFDLEDQRIKDNVPFNFYGSINYSDAKTPDPSYTALANYVDDYGGTESNNTASINYGSPTARPEIWVQSYYAQDSWKVRPNLTLEYGLRYEFNGAPLNYLPFPAISASDPGAFGVRYPEISDKTNVAPRLGINYGYHNNTVVSAGFGMFYDHVFTNIIDNLQSSAPNDSAKTIYTNPNDPSGRGTPNWSNILSTITDKIALPTDTAVVTPQHLIDPLTFEYNLRVQQRLPSDFSLSAAYVGSRTEHQYATTEFNAFQADGSRRLSDRGRIIRYDNTADSNYQSGQLELEHREKGGLTMRASYTFSKGLDDGSEIFTDAAGNLSTYQEIQYPAPRGREYAASAFDHRHIVSGSLVYSPPIWHAEGAAKIAANIVNRWTFGAISAFQSGQPVNPEIGYDWNGDGIGNDRPILSNKRAPLSTWAVRGEDFFPVAAGTLCDGPTFWDTTDPCLVVTPDQVHWVTSHFGTTENTISRNSLFADHISDTDFSVGRSFKTFEKQDFEFRAEAINAFNHGNTGAFNASLTTNTFAPGFGTNTFGNEAITSAGHRNLRFYVRYEF